MSVFRGTCYATNSLVYSVDTSSHEQTGKIIIFAQFEEVNLVENGHNTEEYEPFLSSIDEASTYHDSDDGYISTNTIKDIW